MSETRIAHREVFPPGSGRWSALCFKRPQAPHFRRAFLTHRDAEVTCKKCLAIIAARSDRTARETP